VGEADGNGKFDRKKTAEWLKWMEDNTQLGKLETLPIRKNHSHINCLGAPTGVTLG